MKVPIHNRPVPFEIVHCALSNIGQYSRHTSTQYAPLKTVKDMRFCDNLNIDISAYINILAYQEK